MACTWQTGVCDCHSLQCNLQCGVRCLVCSCSDDADFAALKRRTKVAGGGIRRSASLASYVTMDNVALAHWLHSKSKLHALDLPRQISVPHCPATGTFCSVWGSHKCSRQQILRNIKVAGQGQHMPRLFITTLGRIPIPWYPCKHLVLLEVLASANFLIDWSYLSMIVTGWL